MASDKVFHSRSQGIPSEGVKDQYADGKAARIWKKYIGDSNKRTQNYRNFLTGILRKHGCVKVLDAACGTGYVYNLYNYIYVGYLGTIIRIIVQLYTIQA